MKQPLAFRMRPQHLDDVIGQQHLIGEGRVLRRCVPEKRLFSMIFYGPPGTGRAALAMVLASELGFPFRMFNAVTGNKKDPETIFQEAKSYEGLIVIIGEVHRLNKDKQNPLLLHVENGNITLIGTTASNPLHAINPAIRSRCHLFETKQAQRGDIEQALMKAVHHQDGPNNSVQIEERALHIITRHNSGDIRYSFSIPEIYALAGNGVITQELVSQHSQFPNMSVDGDGDGYYDVLSGFQRSTRGNDVNTAPYYLGIMIEANNMSSIERRLLVTAYEGIGLGNPAAVTRCVTAIDATKRIDFPEARIILAVAVVDLTLSPRSKNAEHAIDAIMSTLRHTSHSIPDYPRFAPVNMDDDEKYGCKRSDLWSRIQCLPDGLKSKHFYESELASSYGKILAQNLEKLRKVPRTSSLRALKKQSSR